MAVIKVAGNPDAAAFSAWQGSPAWGRPRSGIDRPTPPAGARGALPSAECATRPSCAATGARYVGALPGRVGTHAQGEGKTPVILLDESTSSGQSWNGSPEAALLELLDHRADRSFTTITGAAFDLSEAPSSARATA